MTALRVGLRALLAQVVTVGFVGSVVLPGVGPMCALKAAGFAGGSAISGIAGFFSALTGNLTWLAVTALGFAVTLIAILFLAGHSRAHDIALRVGIGVFLLVAGPGIVA